MVGKPDSMIILSGQRMIILGLKIISEIIRRIGRKIDFLNNSRLKINQ